ncbi:MAG: DedA family protein [Tissierellia bacterium]|nr:DedA family protein [Tissierellia bacterium]
MEQTIINAIETYGYVAVFTLLLLETVFPPIPSEVILLTTGVAVAHTEMTGMAAIGFSTFGSYIGACLLYTLGRKVPLEKLRTWSTKGIMAKFGLDYTSILKGKRIFQEKGNLIVFFGRFIPMIRSIISIPAGMSKMNFFSFSLFTLLGSGLWNSLSICIGYKAGDSWRDILRFFHYYTEIILIILVIVLGGLFYLWKRRN